MMQKESTFPRQTRKLWSVLVPTTLLLASFVLLVPSGAAIDQCVSRTGLFVDAAPQFQHEAVREHSYEDPNCGLMEGYAVFTAFPPGCLDACAWAYEVSAAL